MHFRSLRKCGSEVSLSESIDTDKDGNSLSLIDVISDDEDMLEGIAAQETNEQLHRMIASELDGREREILTLRYGLDGGTPRAQREVAEKCGISRSYVSRRQ